MKQKSLSRWLRFAIIIVGVIGLFVYAFILPSYGASLAHSAPEFAYRYWPWLIFLWITAVPCYAALVLGWMIALNIGNDRSFSLENAKYLKWISWLAAADSIYFFAGNIVLLFLNMSHPGITLFSLAITFAGVAVTIAAAVLSHMVRKACDIQELNEMTI